jgi:hypothetical protein
MVVAEFHINYIVTHYFYFIWTGLFTLYLFVLIFGMMLCNVFRYLAIKYVSNYSDNEDSIILLFVAIFLVHHFRGVIVMQLIIIPGMFGFKYMIYEFFTVHLSFKIVVMFAIMSYLIFQSVFWFMVYAIVFDNDDYAKAFRLFLMMQVAFIAATMMIFMSNYILYNYYIIKIK